MLQDHGHQAELLGADIRPLLAGSGTFSSGLLNQFRPRERFGNCTVFRHAEAYAFLELLHDSMIGFIWPSGPLSRKLGT
jgi:hypothetical protein